MHWILVDRRALQKRSATIRHALAMKRADELRVFVCAPPVFRPLSRAPLGMERLAFDVVADRCCFMAKDTVMAVRAACRSARALCLRDPSIATRVVIAARRQRAEQQRLMQEAFLASDDEEEDEAFEHWEPAPSTTSTSSLCCQDVAVFGY